MFREFLAKFLPDVWVVSDLVDCVFDLFAEFSGFFEDFIVGVLCATIAGVDFSFRSVLFYQLSLRVYVFKI